MILDKFKEKKPNVVTALREASDAIFPSVCSSFILSYTFMILYWAEKIEWMTFISHQFRIFQNAKRNKTRET